MQMLRMLNPLKDTFLLFSALKLIFISRAGHIEDGIILLGDGTFAILA